MFSAKMRSLADLPDRHVTIARNEGDYISFPDVCLTKGGRLICAYRVAEKHVATRSRTEIRTSEDRGKTWSEPLVLSSKGHCPRLTVLEDGEVLLITDSSDVGGAVYRSSDEGRTWSKPTRTGLGHGIPDRPLRIGPTSLLTTGHRHDGRKRTLLGQATSEQFLYRSDDLGRSWNKWGVLAFSPYLVLCEASMFKMPDGSLRVFLRENAGVQEPTFLMESFDEGRSWSKPLDTPTMGHRPCAGRLQSGKALVTYRHVGPNGGNRAWLGDPDKERFFAPSAFDLGKGARLTGDTLVIENAAGDRDAVLYALRPMTDPRTAKAQFDAELAVERSEQLHCGVHLGCLWLVFPDRVQAQVGHVDPVPLDATQFHRYTFAYDRGIARLSVDGELRCEVDLRKHGLKLDRFRRPVRVGNVQKGQPWWGPFRFEKNAGKSVWRSMRLHIDEPRHRRYEWSWTPKDGLPNQYEVDRILELQNDRHSSRGDFGYSGWTQFPDGEIFCAVHYRGDAKLSYVVGTWMRESDFGG